MCGATAARRIPLLSKLRIADAAAAFSAVGFNVSEQKLNIGGINVELIGKGNQHSWAWKDGISSTTEAKDLDGISTDVEGFEIFGQSLEFSRAPPHPNLAQALYSISLATPNLQRTLAVLSGSLGEPREVLKPTPEISMALFKLGSPSGPVVVEVIAPSTAGTAMQMPGIAADLDAPASIVGMVVVTPHLEHLSSLVGTERIGKIRPAMQGQGRLIAPMVQGEAGTGDGLALGLAFMTPPNQAALQSTAKSGSGKGLSTMLSTSRGPSSL